MIERENRGLVASLNEAVDASRGEFLAREIDADDVCMPERLVKQVTFLEKHAEVGVVGSAIETFGGGMWGKLFIRSCRRRRCCFGRRWAHCVGDDSQEVAG